MKLEKQEEDEMEKLLGEIPHATSSHSHVHTNGVDPHIHDHFHYRPRSDHARGSISPLGGGAASGWSVDEEYLRLLAMVRSLQLEPQTPGPQTPMREIVGGIHYGYDRRHDMNFKDSYRVPRSDPLFGNFDAGGYANAGRYGGVDGRFGANSRLNACGHFLGSYLQPEQNGVDLNLNGRFSLLNAGISQQAMASKLHYDSLASPLQHGWDPPVKNVSDFELFRSDDSFILQGERMHFGNSQRREQLSQRDWRMLQCRSNPGLQSSSSLPPHYYNFVDDEKYIYYIAKDQYGCRYLQKKFDEGTRQEVDSIFNGIINHVVELMVNPFGNYLVQKLLDVCTEEQRMKIILVLTKDPDELLTISLNIHGTRAVQKLIETLKTRQQVKLVVSALQPGFLDLIKDLNGNHVVQRCLQSLSAEDNKFIFDAAAKHCLDIATHRHGCCVLQRCIEHSTGRYRENLLAEISCHGLLLAQDGFGNYVVQFILGLENPLATATLVSQFCGNYLHLSMQKFSSNVVEKCLKVFSEKDQATIILELLAAPRLDQLLQDPYANYVFQSALRNTKGALHAELSEAIRPYGPILRTSPYCKRIFSGPLSKK